MKIRWWQYWKWRKHALFWKIKAIDRFHECLELKKQTKKLHEGMLTIANNYWAEVAKNKILQKEVERLNNLLTPKRELPKPRCKKV